MTQWLTLAKVGGAAGEALATMLRTWNAARRTSNPHQWEPSHWPAEVRAQADGLYEAVRANATRAPVLYYSTWFDPWSMGCVFSDWMAAKRKALPGGADIMTDRIELWWHALPDGGRLAKRLARAKPQQFDETDWLIARMREAVHAWEKLAPTGVLLLFREVVGGLTLDEDVDALTLVPEWVRPGEMPES